MCNKCKDALQQGIKWCIGCGDRIYPSNSNQLNIEVELSYDSECYVRTVDGQYYAPITFKATLDPKLNNNKVNFRQITDSSLVKSLKDLYDIITGDTLP